MSDQIVEYIEAEIAKKNPKSVRGLLKAYRTIINNDLDPEVVRLATHMLKYVEQEELEKRFRAWLVKHSQVLGKKVHRMSRQEVAEARERFLDNEKSSK